jgi:mannan endo-1,4-beta-mannosidase
MSPRNVAVLISTMMFLWGLTSMGASAAARPPAVVAARSKILEFLGTLRAAHQSIAGTQINEYEAFLKCNSVDRLANNVGDYPALVGLELMFAKEYAGYEDLLVRHAVTQTRRGGLVTLTWHARNPLKVCARGENYECARAPMSDAEFDRMLTPGTPEHVLWEGDVAAAAKTLKRLQDAGVVVLFRPYHEMNGGWFWWGKKKSFPKMWDALYEELESKHALRNLIWVWAGDRSTPDAATYWPGKHPPAIAGSDVYEKDPDSPEFLGGLKSIRALDTNVIFAFTEIGHLPSEAVLEATQPVWVLVWGGGFIDARLSIQQPCDQCNTPKELAAFFRKPRMVSLAELPAGLRAAIARGRPAAPARPPECPATLLPGG